MAGGWRCRGTAGSPTQPLRGKIEELIALSGRELRVRTQQKGRVRDARFAKPLDAELIALLAAEHELLVTIEDGVLQGGFGSAVAEHLVDHDLAGDVRVLRVGLPDRYVTHGKPALLHKEVGLTPEAVVERVLSAVDSRVLLS